MSVSSKDPRLLGQCGQQGPVRGGLASSRHLAVQHGQLVVEDCDLDVLVVELGPSLNRLSTQEEHDRGAHDDDLPFGPSCCSATKSRTCTLQAT